MVGHFRTLLLGIVADPEAHSVLVGINTVIPRRSNSRLNLGGDNMTSLSTMTSRAPFKSAPQISCIAASKQTFKVWATTSDPSMVRKFELQKSLMTPRCITEAILGCGHLTRAGSGPFTWPLPRVKIGRNLQRLKSEFRLNHLHQWFVSAV